MDSVSSQDWQADRDDAIAEIAGELLKGRVGFLVGAGMSQPSGSLSTNLLSETLLKYVYYRGLDEPLDLNIATPISEVARKFPLEAIAQGIVPKLSFGDTGLQRLLSESVFGGRIPDPHKGHIALASLVTKLNIKHLFTTNWDELLEKALGERGRVITEKDFPSLNDIIDSGKTAIVHLHGIFAEPTIKEADLMDPNRPLFQVFLGEFLTKAFVFVGYSLNDPHIKMLYYKSGEMLSRFKKKTYIVSPFESDLERRVSGEVWRQRNATYLPMTSEDFFRGLYEKTVTYALAQLKRKLSKRLNLSAVELQRKVEEIVSVFPSFENHQQVLLYLDALTRGGDK